VLSLPTRSSRFAAPSQIDPQVNGAMRLRAKMRSRISMLLRVRAGSYDPPRSKTGRGLYPAPELQAIADTREDEQKYQADPDSAASEAGN
jgi:hypothetical protein